MIRHFRESLPSVCVRLTIFGLSSEVTKVFRALKGIYSELDSLDERLTRLEKQNDDRPTER